MSITFLQGIGNIIPPMPIRRFGPVANGALGRFIQLFFDILIIAGGIYAVFNFILAGYSFLSAGSDPKKVSDAWRKIWQTMIGLLFMAGAFLLAAIVGRLIFGDATFLIDPIIPTL